MPTYRVCKQFVVESGHMLSKHPGRCRFPHGHTRTVEIVLVSEALDSNDMVVDFKAVKLAIGAFVNRFDHAMAVNSRDPLLPAMKEAHPDSLVVFEHRDPTTEVIAEEIFSYAKRTLATGWQGDGDDARYRIEPGRCRVERVRVWETPSSWAEFED